MRRKSILVLLALTLILTMYGCGQKDNAVSKLEVKAENGTYVGHDNNGVAEFLGISYAAPVEKWKAPAEPETTSEDVIACDEWGPSSIQIKDDVEIASAQTQSSDCLDLNIWTKDVTTKDKPVIVFIHGGGAWQGGTYDPCYDGEYFIRNLAEDEDAVMVTINYRLGILGSLNLSLLDGYTDEYADANNLATLDQIQALKWVNKNISAFGGDPSNVTVAGQSSGAGSVSTLLTIESATPYFHNAIIESGTLFNRQISVAESEERAEKAFQILGVSTVDELVNLSDEDIIAKYDKIDEALHLDTNVPEPQRVADGKLIPLDGYQALKEGSANGINIMIGTTDGEYDWLASDWDNYPNAVTEVGDILDPLETGNKESAALGTTWTPIVDQAVVEEYFAQSKDSVKRAVDLYNDTKYRQTAIYLSEALAENGSDVYMFYWKWAPDMNSVLETQGDSAEVSPWGRAMHCMDQVIAFGTIEEGYTELTGPAEEIPKELIAATQKMWYAFAKTGNPNNDLLPEWKPYNKDARQTMVIEKDGTWKLVSDPRAKDRKILDQLRPE